VQRVAAVEVRDRGAHGVAPLDQHRVGGGIFRADDHIGPTWRGQGADARPKIGLDALDPLGLRGAHFLRNLAGRHVIGLGLESGCRTRYEAGDLRAGRKLDADIDPAISGDLIATIEDRADRKTPAPQIGLAEPGDQKTQTLVVEREDMLGCDVEEGVLGHGYDWALPTRVNPDPGRSPP